MKFFLLAVLLLSVFSSNSYAVDWGKVAESMVPEGSAEEKKLKESQDKDKKKEEKFKKIIDKEFEKEFKKVFDDKVTPSDALEVIKALEAATAGDYKVAGENAANALIAKYIPGIGTYITVLKAAESIMKDKIEKWSAEIYTTNVYQSAKKIIYAGDDDYPGYVPSYLINSIRGTVENSDEIDAIQKDMRMREKRMYTAWVDANALEIDYMKYGDPNKKSIKDMLNGAGWAAKFRARYGKDLNKREIFNRFLHHIATPRKQHYLEELQYEYVKPLMDKEVSIKSAKLKNALSVAIENAIRKIKLSEEAEKESIQKEEKIVFFDAGGNENAFRDEMRSQRARNAKDDVYKANISHNQASSSRREEKQQFRNDMQELAGSLQGVQNSLVAQDYNQNYVNNRQEPSGPQSTTTYKPDWNVPVTNQQQVSNKDIELCVKRSRYSRYDDIHMLRMKCMEEFRADSSGLDNNSKSNMASKEIKKCENDFKRYKGFLENGFYGFGGAFAVSSDGRFCGMSHVSYSAQDRLGSAVSSALYACDYDRKQAGASSVCSIKHKTIKANIK